MKNANVCFMCAHAWSIDTMFVFTLEKAKDWVFPGWLVWVQRHRI